MEKRPFCGKCGSCIEFEFDVLARIDHANWASAAGDISEYRRRTQRWIRLFEVEGLALS